MRTLNLVRKRFHRLIATEKILIEGKSFFNCICDCGNNKTIAGWRLNGGRIQSCGCAIKEADKVRNIDKRLKEGLSCARRVIGYYKRNAEKRNILFELTEEECLNIFKQNCTYCDRPPFNIISYKGYHGNLIYTGIDRLNNEKGYIIKNVVPCCKDCNYMKRDLSHKEFSKIIKLIYKNLNNNNI